MGGVCSHTAVPCNCNSFAPKRRFNAGIAELSKLPPQVPLMLWEKNPKLRQLIKIHHMLILSYIGSSRIICTFTAFSFKKCLKRNANKNVTLARVLRLSSIPNSHWKTVNNHMNSDCRNPNHLSHCAYTMSTLKLLKRKTSRDLPSNLSFQTHT